MTRLARVVCPDTPHHITQRGNRQAKVFFDDVDRRRYLVLLAEQCSSYGLAIRAYCLMTNHVHLIIVPSDVEGLGRAMRRLNSRYSLYVNRRMGWSGHLWEGRFFSSPLDERHLWLAVRYVERNPVRAAVVDRAETYPWSSAAAHCGLRTDPFISGDLERAGVVDDWGAWLAEVDESLEQVVRERTRTGRPCGSEQFICGLETALGRPLVPRRAGRKPKQK